MLRLAAEEGAVATSSVLRRSWRRSGETTHHLIDPRTGVPSDSAAAAVTVVAAHAHWAEVLAKAALIAGIDAGLELRPPRVSAGRRSSPSTRARARCPPSPAPTARSAALLTVGPPALPAKPNVTGHRCGMVLSWVEGDGVAELAPAAEASAPRVVRPGGPTTAAPSHSGGGRCHAAPPHGR